MWSSTGIYCRDSLKSGGSLILSRINRSRHRLRDNSFEQLTIEKGEMTVATHKQYWNSFALSSFPRKRSRDWLKCAGLPQVGQTDHSTTEISPTVKTAKWRIGCWNDELKKYTVANRVSRQYYLRKRHNWSSRRLNWVSRFEGNESWRTFAHWAIASVTEAKGDVIKPHCWQLRSVIFLIHTGTCLQFWQS